jgi:hypothetical protein
LGCEVTWLEECGREIPATERQARVRALKARLEPYGLADRLAVVLTGGDTSVPAGVEGCLDLAAAAEADLLLNASYRMPPEVVGRFRRSALLDIDPGMLQRWISRGEIRVARYDLHFTIGETVGRPGAAFPDAGLRWFHTKPCLALDWWDTQRAAPGAPFSTISHWYMHEWVEDDDGTVYENNKRRGFEPYFDLPRRTGQPLELALCLGPGDEREREMLQAHGWSVRHAHDVAGTPWDYQEYIRRSRGEFSCAKPSYRRLRTAWVSDRTLCYLASGKPVVIEDTGPSSYLPSGEGMFRFGTPDGALAAIEAVNADYERHCCAARALAEEFFDAKSTVTALLDVALC